MLKNYWRSAYRSLLRNRVPSVINIVGLSIALASCITVYLFLQVYYSLDTFHAQAERIFMVEHVAATDGEPQTWGTAPLPLGPALAADLPQVDRAVRLDWATGDVRTAEASFEERVGFADAGFFDVFSFPLTAGTPAALDAPGAVILSARAAARYFDTTEALGRTLSIAVGEAPARVYTVAGVAAPFPNNAGLRFDVLLPFADRPASARPDDWSARVSATFLLLRAPGDLAQVTAQMDGYVARTNAATPEAPVARFVFENLADPAPGAHKVLRRPTEAPHPAFSLLMIGLAAFMMALSCFNYVNITLGSAARRIPEVGVRKVLGGTRRDFVVQFMAENLLLCALSLGLGVVLAKAVLVPLFNATFVLEIGLSLAEDPFLWLFLAGLLAFVGVASGAYPAFYVASFQPALILKGAARLGEHRWLTRGLTTVQFTIAILAVLATVVLGLNGRYLAHQAWGYDPAGVVVVTLTDPAQAAPLGDAAAAQAGVIGVATAQDHLGRSFGRVSYRRAPDAPEAHTLALSVGPGYAELIGLPLRQGRFLDARDAGAEAGVVVNARFAAEQGWEEPLTQSVEIAGRQHAVVGVVADFLHDPISQARPFVLLPAPDGARFLVVRTEPGREAAVEEALAAVWKRSYPDLPFEADAQADVFDQQLGAYANLVDGLGYLAGLALFIACLGVFGLATQNVARRMKEVGVRKVLGASVPGLLFVVNRALVVMLALAAAVATGVTYGGLRLLLGLAEVNFMPLTPFPFLVGYALVLAAVAVSVAAQTRTLARVSPADILRRA